MCVCVFRERGSAGVVFCGHGPQKGRNLPRVHVSRLAGMGRMQRDSEIARMSPNPYRRAAITRNAWTAAVLEHARWHGTALPNPCPITAKSQQLFFFALTAHAASTCFDFSGAADGRPTTPDPSRDTGARRPSKWALLRQLHFSTCASMRARYALPPEVGSRGALRCAAPRLPAP